MNSKPIEGLGSFPKIKRHLMNFFFPEQSVLGAFVLLWKEILEILEMNYSLRVFTNTLPYRHLIFVAGERVHKDVIPESRISLLPDQCDIFETGNTKL
jgi:hypothetical protein